MVNTLVPILKSANTITSIKFTPFCPNFHKRGENPLWGHGAAHKKLHGFDILGWEKKLLTLTAHEFKIKYSSRKAEHA